MENLSDMIKNQRALNETQINSIIDSFSYSVGHVSAELPDASSVKIDDTIMELKYKVNSMLSQQYLESLLQAQLGNTDVAPETLKNEVEQFRAELLELLENAKNAILAYTNGSSLNVSHYDMNFPVFRYEDRSAEINRIKDVYEETIEHLKEAFEQEDSKFVNKAIHQQEEEQDNSKEDSYYTTYPELDSLFGSDTVQQPKEKQDSTKEDSHYSISVSDLKELFGKQNIRTSGVQEATKQIRKQKESLSPEQQKKIKEEVSKLFTL